MSLNKSKMISLYNVINSLNNTNKKQKSPDINNKIIHNIKKISLYYLLPILIILIEISLIYGLYLLLYINIVQKKKSLVASKSVICLDIYRGLNYQNLEFKDIPIQYKNPYYIEGNARTGPLHYDLKLCDFYISSSRKTYLSCGECEGDCSYDAINYALLKGARLINLDIYDVVLFNKKIPVIKNSNSDINKKQYLDFITVLKIIKNSAWKLNKNYPLIIYFEFFNKDDDGNITKGFGDKDNKKTEETLNIYNMVSNSLKKILGYGSDIKSNNRIVGRTWGFAGKNSNSKINLAPIKYLKGKVIFYSNYYPTYTSLDELIHGYIHPTENICPTVNIPPSFLSEFVYCNKI